MSKELEECLKELRCLANELHSIICFNHICTKYERDIKSDNCATCELDAENDDCIPYKMSVTIDRARDLLEEERKNEQRN